jgi:lysophospholipase L1-like esterase
MNYKRVALISILINAGAILFLVGKRLLFQQKVAATQSAISYLDNPQYAEQVNIQSAYSKPARIVIMGNSHVYKAHWDELLNRNDVVARGIGSDITEGYLRRIGQVLSVRPRICFIEGGANDVFYHKDVSAVLKNIEQLVDTLRNAGVTPVLHLLPPFTRHPEGAASYNGRIWQLNDGLRAMCVSKGIQYIDLFALLSEDGYLPDRFAQADGIHLTAEAYKKWADRINALIHTLDNSSRTAIK